MGFIIAIVGILLVALPSITAEVLINEIRYDVPGSDAGHEWIEIINTGWSSLNLTRWKLYEQGVNHNLNLMTGSLILSTGEFAVIADDAATFQQDYPAFAGTLFDSVFSLSNTGEYLAFYNGSDFVGGVNYSSSWGGGNSYSLERLNEVWNTSLVQTGTPGKVNSILPCTSNWTIIISDWVNQTACLHNDTYFQNRTVLQYDLNNCQQNQTGVESQILSCDYDADGFIGNISHLNSSLTLSWEKKATSIIFREGNKTMVEFPILGGTLFFSDLFLEKQSNESRGYTLVRGWVLNDSQTKTVLIDALNSTSNAVCIKDAEVNSISEMSANCNGENETIVLCNGELQNGYRCTAGERFILSGARHSAVQEFYIAPAVPAPAEPVPSSSAGGGGGGGGGGGSSCPSGKTVVKGKCVAIVQSSQLPSEEAPTEQDQADTENRPPIIVVEKDIEIDFSKAKPMIRKPLLTNLPVGNEITGAVAGVPEKSLSVIPLLVIGGIVIFSWAAAWMVKGRKG